MPLGVVTNLHRSGVPGDDSGRPQLVANIDGVGPAVPCTYFGSPPPPLTVCSFSGGPVWHCDGIAYGDSRVVLHEDFLYVPTLTSAGTLAADTNWTVPTLTAGGSIATSATALGAAALATHTTLNAVTRVEKSDNCLVPPSAPAGLWFSGSLTCASAVTNRTILFGFSDNGLQDAAFIRLVDPGTAWTLQTIAGGSSTVDSTSIPTGPTAGVYQTFDIVLVSGTYAAFWVDGDGPYVATLTVPSAATGVWVFLQNSTAGASRAIVVDFARVEYVSNLVNPSTDERLQQDLSLR